MSSQSPNPDVQGVTASKPPSKAQPDRLLHLLNAPPRLSYLDRKAMIFAPTQHGASNRDGFQKDSDQTALSNTSPLPYEPWIVDRTKQGGQRVSARELTVYKPLSLLVNPAECTLTDCRPARKPWKSVRFMDEQVEGHTTERSSTRVHETFRPATCNDMRGNKG
ncbi:hypothetical protein Q7P37_006393 [Cladosporium fusiforme]